MNMKIARSIAMIAGHKDRNEEKAGRKILTVIISPFLAIMVLIGAIFADGINFNQDIITRLFENKPITGFSGEQAEYINEIQHGLSLIDTKINETNQTITNGGTLNVYQIKGYFIGLMFSKQKMKFDEAKAKSWVRSFTSETEKNKMKKIVPTSVNSTIYNQLETNLSVALYADTREMMERVYGGLIGNNSGTVTTLSKEEMDKLLSHLSEGTSELRKNIILQAGDAVGKIPYYWGGAASCKGYDGNDFGKVVTPDYKGRNRKGLDCSHFVDWVYWTVMNNNLGNTNTAGQIKMCRKISTGELLAGDLAFLINKEGKTTHVGIYAGRNEKGEMVWIHENAHDNNVAVNTVSYWSGYYRLKIMEGR